MDNKSLIDKLNQCKRLEHNEWAALIGTYTEEDRAYTAIRSRYPDCAVTLSVGERSRQSYEALFAAGADRYLLRHETANAGHYAKLHLDARL